MSLIDRRLCAQAWMLMWAMLVTTAVVIELSNWNWYGFSISYTMVNIADTALTFFVTGLVLGAVSAKLSPAAA